MTREHIGGSRPYDPRLNEEPAHNWETYYGYYGLSPYWEGGYVNSSYPLTSDERTGQSNQNRSQTSRSKFRRTVVD